MGIIARAFAPDSVKSLSFRELLRDYLGNNQTSTGKTVNYKNAVQVSAVFAVCRVIGEGIAQVPLKLMQESGKERLPAKDHPLYQILSYRPNDFQTSFEFREMLAWHCVLAGNHYSFINRGVNGRIIELLPLEPSMVEPKRKDWTMTYEVTGSDGSRKTFPAEAIWHVRGPSWDGWQGLDAVKLAREAIGLAMVTENATGAMHRNGLQASGVYSVEGVLKPDQYKDLADWIDTHNAGAANAGKPLILDRTAKWSNTQMTGIDAQSLETRRYQVEEICRFARVMPIMVGYSDKAATYASAEQMFLAHVVHTLAPWFERLEQSIDTYLLTEADRKAGIYSNFVEEGLLRGAAKDTKDVILGYVNGGLMTPNEGREKLDMNPDSDPASDKLRIPANIVGEVPQDDPKQAETVKALDAMSLEIKSVRQIVDRPAPQPQINVDARTTVNPGEPANITFNVPETKAADVTLNIEPTTINVPAPVVNIEASKTTFNMPEPIINLEATMPTPQVIVSLPPRKTETEVTLDSDGNIRRAVQIERDID
jgi:HK97 family phage portal protein